MDEREVDRGVLVDDPCEEEGEGIAIRTATLIVEGDELELIMSCAIELEIFAGIERELVPSSADDGAGTVELGFKNILARVSKEGIVVPVKSSAVYRFSPSSLLGIDGSIGVEKGMETGGERLVRLGVERE